MNAKELKKNIGSLFRLRPLPWRFDGGGNRLEDSDDRWRLEAVDASPARIRIVNISTGHVADLEADNIIERRSPDFLILRCQLSVRPGGLSIEPIFRGTPVVPTSSDPQSRLPQLSADEEALVRCIVSEGGVVHQHSESHTDSGLNQIRYEQAVDSLLARQFIRRERSSAHMRLFPKLSLTADGRRWAIENGLA
jgi:hypothetical protein